MPQRPSGTRCECHLAPSRSQPWPSAPPPPAPARPRSRRRRCPRRARTASRSCSRSRRRTRRRPRSARSRRISRRSGCSRRRGSRSSRRGASPTTPRIRSRPGWRSGAPASCRCSPTPITWPASCSPTARCGGGSPFAWAWRCARSVRAASCSTGATCRSRRAPATRPSCSELRGELGPRAQIVVTVPPVRTKHALRTGSYDLRALARPARLLVLAWNEHGPRSETGPGRVARVLEADAAHGAAGRPALARPHGRADLGLALERRSPAPEPSRRRRRSSSPRPRSRRSSAPTARAWARTRGSSPTAPCS